MLRLQGTKLVTSVLVCGTAGSQEMLIIEANSKENGFFYAIEEGPL